MNASSIKQEKTTKKTSKVVPIIIAILFLILAGVGGYFLIKEEGLLGQDQGSDYSAVFLTNGSVYFGRLSSRPGRYLTLKNVYFLKTWREIVEQQEKEGQTTKTPGKLNIQPRPIESGIHQPTSTMEINKDHVLFIERLQKESQILKAITEGTIEAQE